MISGVQSRRESPHLQGLDARAVLASSVGSARAQALLVCAAVLLCCAGGEPSAPRACLEVAAGAALNLHEGQPHALVLSFYPLRDVGGFAAADVRDLLRGGRPSGLSGEPWEETLLPGQSLRVEEPLPRDTRSLGVVADFYRAPVRAVLRASCGRFRGAALLLSAGDLRVLE